jgi:hypothetical protein
MEKCCVKWCKRPATVFYELSYFNGEIYKPMAYCNECSILIWKQERQIKEEEYIVLKVMNS